MDIRKIIGNNLRNLREDLDLEQKQVAEKLEIAIPTYNNYETGYRLPDADTLKKIATFSKQQLIILLGKPKMII